MIRTIISKILPKKYYVISYQYHSDTGKLVCGHTTSVVDALFPKSRLIPEVWEYIKSNLKNTLGDEEYERADIGKLVILSISRV